MKRSPIRRPFRRYVAFTSSGRYQVVLIMEGANDLGGSRQPRICSRPPSRGSEQDDPGRPQPRHPRVHGDDPSGKSRRLARAGLEVTRLQRQRARAGRVRGRAACRRLWGVRQRSHAHWSRRLAPERAGLREDRRHLLRRDPGRPSKTPPAATGTSAPWRSPVSPQTGLAPLPGVRARSASRRRPG